MRREHNSFTLKYGRISIRGPDFASQNSLPEGHGLLKQATFVGAVPLQSGLRPFRSPKILQKNMFYNTFYRKILPKVQKIFILNDEVNGNLLNKIKEIKWIF